MASVIQPALDKTVLWDTVTEPTRVIDTEYTNDGGSPRFVTVYCYAPTTAGSVKFLLNGSELFYGTVVPSGVLQVFSLIVPTGATYEVENTSGNAAVNDWVEVQM